MLDQLLSFCLAVLLFPLFICLPGWVLGYSADLFGFRQRPIAVRMSLALSLSFAVCPILVYLVVRVSGGFSTAWLIFGIVWLIAAWMAIQHRAFSVIPAVLAEKKTIAIVAVWFVVCALSEIDLVIGHEVLLDLNTIDSVAHVAFTDALTRTGIPPINPFVLPGSPAHLFYYYLWYLMCSLVDQLGGAAVTARAAVQAGTFYIGLTVAGLAASMLEILGERILPGVRKIPSAMAAGLLLITGLDLVPVLFVYLLKAVFGKGSGAGASIEWWNDDQVTAWLGAILMSPHHVAGVIICFTGALLMTCLIQPVTPARRILLIVLSAVTFASAMGVSSYVTFALAAGLLLWAAMLALRREWTAVVSMAIAGTIALLLYIPFALELRSSGNMQGFPLSLTVRAFIMVDYWLPSVFTYLKTANAATLIYVLRLVFLPVNYLFELGYFFVATFFYWRWRRTIDQRFSREEQLFACLAAGSVLICTFFRSTFRWNDLGWRGFLVAQFVFLIWAIHLTKALFRSERSAILPAWLRWIVWSCLVIGLAGTIWDVSGFRINKQRPRGPEPEDLRDAYIWITHHTPPDTEVLYNPDTQQDNYSSQYRYPQALNAGKA